MKMIDGLCFRNMVDFGVRNLNLHVKLVNKLNVFPVPDGDTGTNMVTTIHKGLLAVDETIADLSSVSKKFARSVVYEARGNSGVIVSQFLKGISEKFYGVDTADSKLFIEALEKGVSYAYLSVATPVEGTMLTVMKDATNAVKQEHNPQQSISDVINAFVIYAKKSLENTPEILPVLKDSGVVDSGGAGLVYLFEGMKKYLDGESLEAFEDNSSVPSVDYEAFNMESKFEYGYCTELLVQLLNSRDYFDCCTFKNELSLLGDSLVISRENDKVRVHIHTPLPEKVFELCHKYGEFLSLKIENMTVQHTELTKRIMCAKSKNSGLFSVVAVAFDSEVQKLFLDMGADVVICCHENVSTKDYLDAFEKTETDNIFVFPNSSDAILSAMQAKKLYQKAKVYVLNSRTVAECYSALPAIDFEETDIEKISDDITEIINNLYVVSIARRKNSIRYGNRDIYQNEYYSFSGKELIVIDESLTQTAVETIKKIVKSKEKEIVTIFYRSSVSEEKVNAIVEASVEQGVCAEFFTVYTENLPCELTISFE